MPAADFFFGYPDPVGDLVFYKIAPDMGIFPDNPLDQAELVFFGGPFF